MSEWWSYDFSDFLMYSLRSYLRLIQAYNKSWEPLPVFASMIGIGIAVSLWRGSLWRGAALALASAWAFVGVAFFWQRFSSIHWGMHYAATAFMVEALLLALVAWQSRPLDIVPRQRAAAMVFALCGLALPSIGMFTGRQWNQLESFGMTADPTALATIAWLALAPGRWRALLLPVPVAWCLFSAATWCTLRAWDWIIVTCALTLALAVSFVRPAAAR
ncbi:DUF6064 family protein [Tahibacter amnicola]|uniref:DUF6064 family protein n=1 Tax=Tahibacter amnicola TaxID=2976241 RepID=A0ABY6BP11_9GAMM|nr:DUF6064 family protein [Tahibacter amnicola]UXI70135.1 DUF6064 family protein [Tahibacter amnicola]